MKKFLCAAFLVAIFLPSVALAGVGIGIDNQYKVFDIDDSTTEDEMHHFEGVFKAVNDTTAPIELFLATVDGVYTDTGYYLKNHDDDQDAFGVWASFDEKHRVFKLNPKQRLAIPFALDIPRGLAPGEYVGAFQLFSQIPDEYRPEGYVDDRVVAGAGAKAEISVGRIIKVNVLGEEVIDVKVGNFSHEFKDGFLTLAYDVENKGNTTINNVLTTKLMKGEEVIIDREGIDKLIPGFVSSKNFNIAEGLEYGSYMLEVTSTLERTRKREGVEPIESPEPFVISFNYLPIKEIAIGVGVVLFFILLIILKMIKRRKFKASLVEYTVKKGDTITDIAAKRGCKWKLLAKINKVGAPYLLTKGQKLLVPPIKK